MRRSIRAAQWLWAVFYLYHLVTWSGIYSVEVSLHSFVPFLALLPLLARREGGVWAAAGTAIAVSSFEPSAVAPTAILVAAALAWRAWRERRLRLYIGAVLAGYLGLYTLGLQNFSTLEPKLWLNLLASASLLALAWRLKLPSACAAGVLCLIPGAADYVPNSVFAQGVWVLSFGFVALVAGVACNWWTRNLRPSDPDAAAATVPPLDDGVR